MLDDLVSKRMYKFLVCPNKMHQLQTSKERKFARNKLMQIHLKMAIKVMLCAWMRARVCVFY